MRFLLVTKPKTMPPPDMILPLIDAMDAWVKKYKQAGKLEQVWGFAGQQGGGGIGNVASLEELDQVMAEFPVGPFSDIQIYYLVDLEKSLEQNRKIFQAMAAPKS